jgi:hypothetical protein
VKPVWQLQGLSKRRQQGSAREIRRQRLQWRLLAELRGARLYTSSLRIVSAFGVVLLHVTSSRLARSAAARSITNSGLLCTAHASISYDFHRGV